MLRIRFSSNYRVIHSAKITCISYYLSHSSGSMPNISGYSQKRNPSRSTDNTIQHMTTPGSQVIHISTIPIASAIVIKFKSQLSLIIWFLLHRHSFLASEMPESIPHRDDTSRKLKHILESRHPDILYLCHLLHDFPPFHFYFWNKKWRHPKIGCLQSFFTSDWPGLTH